MITNRRWLAIGVGLSVLGLGMGWLIADQFPHGYSGGTIRVRGWLLMLSCAVAVPSALGMLCFARAVPWRPLRWIFASAAGVWVVHGVLLAVLMDTPLEPDGGWVTLLTILVCLPSLLRGLGLWTSYYGRPMATVDLIVVIYMWTQTPVEVLARAHVAQATWWMLIPCALSMVSVAALSDP